MTSQNHLRGGPHYSRGIPDSMDNAGAHMLAQKIRDFWRSKGYAPAVRVEPVFNSTAMPHDFQIRSDMIGGQPCLGAKISP